jgi:hypothetical protein
MTAEERLLLTITARYVNDLFGDRDDLLIGIMAALLDLYRVLFNAGADTKDAALRRLGAQHQQLIDAVPEGRGGKALKWLIDSLEAGKLDAAKLLRMPPAGTA